MKRKFLLIGLILIFSAVCALAAGCISISHPDTLQFRLNEDGKSYYLDEAPNQAEIIVPETYNDLPVTKIGNYAFRWCHKTEKIVLPDSIMEIEYQAFLWCDKLKEITIPKNVTLIGANIFDSCLALENIFVAKENPYYQSIDGVLYSKDGKILYKYPAAKAQTSFTILESVEIIASVAFQNNKYLTNLILHDGLQEIQDTTIFDMPLPFNKYENAYYLATETNPYFALIEAVDNKITSCIFHEDTQILTAGAFSHREQLTSVQLSQHLEVIPLFAFSTCKKLQSIVLPNSVTYVDEYAFYECSALASINLEKVEKIQNSAFSYCKNLTSIDLKNATYIGSSAFNYCQKLSSVTFGKVENLKHFAFNDCALTKVELGKELQFIDESTFEDCYKLTEISISKENPLYQSIDGNVYSKDGTILIAYAYGQSSSFVVPDGVTTIEQNVFYYCDTLKKLTLPSSLKVMNYYCIEGCRNLKEIVYKGSLAEWEKVEKYTADSAYYRITIICNDGKTTFKF